MLTAGLRNRIDEGSGRKKPLSRRSRHFGGIWLLTPFSC